MKILFLANHFGTLYFFRRELIDFFIKKGHQVYISIPTDDNGFFSKNGGYVIETPLDRRGMNPFKDLLLILRYRKIIKSVRPDVIFSYTIKSNIYGCLAHHNKYKQVCNITGTGSTFLKNNFSSKICKVLYRLSVKNCYKVFFQNNRDRIFFENNHMVNKNWEIIPGSGCNLEDNQFVPMGNFDVTRFLFIGRVMEVKGIEEYLTMAKCVKAKYPDTEFYIAGWIEEKKWEKIISNYEELGIVHYIGFTKNIKSWIHKCHCTVLPSHGGEGVPNALLESAAAGRACIGSRIGGTEDVIVDNKTGFLFEPESVNDLINKVEKYILMTDDEKINMGKAGRRLVEMNYDRKIIIDKYNEILSDL